MRRHFDAAEAETPQAGAERGVAQDAALAAPGRLRLLSRLTPAHVMPVRLGPLLDH